VEELKSDPQLLAVSPFNFEQHIKYLKENYNICSLSDLVESIKSKKILPKSVAITFDDGYADNYYNAYPILQKYDAPATIFITTSMIGNNSGFWWDMLEILLSNEIPNVLEIEIHGKNYIYNTDNELNKRKSYTELHKLLKSMPSKYRDGIINKISEWAGVENMYLENRRVLNKDEIKKLASDKLIEIGAHTHGHPQLSALTKYEQYQEIRESKVILETITGRDIIVFSYPFGTMTDYNLDSIKICRKIGFEVACSNYQGQVRYNIDCLQLPRFIVRNWAIEVFKYQIKSFWYK
jgi:peptidoglycan/xylan/chitin deacetylase (PgdA/CDA1 family)